jgi:DNA repair protein RecO (recombination protein O)
MHKKFLTRGLVLSKYVSGEANVSIALLTPEWGLIRAAARSARRERSKLRYGLEPLTEGRFSLVRGQGQWRLVGVEQVSRAGAGSALRRAQAGQVMRLLMRLMPGESGDELLYRSVVEGLTALSRVPDDADASAIECVLVLRVLARLGYLPDLPELTPFVESDFFSQELATAARASRKTLVKLINDSLNASGL